MDVSGDEVLKLNYEIFVGWVRWCIVGKWIHVEEMT